MRLRDLRGLGPQSEKDCHFLVTAPHDLTVWVVCSQEGGSNSLQTLVDLRFGVSELPYELLQIEILGCSELVRIWRELNGFVNKAVQKFK